MLSWTAPQDCVSAPLNRLQYLPLIYDEILPQHGQRDRGLHLLNEGKVPLKIFLVGQDRQTTCARRFVFLRNANRIEINGENPITVFQIELQMVHRIVALAIGIPLFRFLPKYLGQRGEKVRADIESARKVTEDANSRLSAVEAKLASLDEEIAKFRVEVEDEIGRDQARIKASLEEESARVVAAAEQEIGAAAAQARRELRHFAADLAVEQAAKQMVLTPATDRALIAEFVGDVNKGGRN